MWLESAAVDVGGQLVGAKDLSRYGTVFIVASIVSRDDLHMIAIHSHLNLFWREIATVEGNLEELLVIVDLDNAVGVLQRPLPLRGGPIVSDRNNYVRHFQLVD